MGELGYHGTESSGLAEVCWEQEEVRLLEFLVWMNNLDDPLEDQVHCFEHQQGLLAVWVDLHPQRG